MTTPCSLDGCDHPNTPCTGACSRMIEEIRNEVYKLNPNFGPPGFDLPLKNSVYVKLPPAASALDTQVGGDHYKKLPIQPMEYSMANGLDACQHTAIKYITRFRDKGGIADLNKAKHVIDMLIEFEGKKS